MIGRLATGDMPSSPPRPATGLLTFGRPATGITQFQRSSAPSRRAIPEFTQRLRGPMPGRSPDIGVPLTEPAFPHDVGRRQVLYALARRARAASRAMRPCLFNPYLS